MSNAQRTLERGAKFPYDAPDAWWDTNGDNPPAAEDWAHAAARGVVSDLKGRRGIKHGFANIDEDIRVEIVASLAEVIRVAAKAQGGAA